MSVKDRYQVKPIKAFETYDWLLNKHYAKRIPSISYAFGLYEGDLLQGVCTFGSPPSRALCIGVCGIDNSAKVNELNRLCVNENLEKNALSLFLSNSLRMLPNDLIIVSYADTSQNHVGYIYQATNWIYTGLSAKRTERYDADNPHKHSKSVTDSKKYLYENLSVRNRPQKHRYVFFTGNKRDKERLKSQLKYKVQPYPKGDNQRYDASYTPNTQQTLF
jgi:hypothetical protein